MKTARSPCRAAARAGAEKAAAPLPSFEDSVWHFSGVPPSCKAAAAGVAAPPSSLTTVLPDAEAEPAQQTALHRRDRRGGARVRAGAHGLRCGVLGLRRR